MFYSNLPKSGMNVSLCPLVVSRCKAKAFDNVNQINSCQHHNYNQIFDIKDSTFYQYNDIINELITLCDKNKIDVSDLFINYQFQFDSNHNTDKKTSYLLKKHEIDIIAFIELFDKLNINENVYNYCIDVSCIIIYFILYK